MDKDTPRLIEVAFPLKQASLDSVHEKNVRHGHISTLHIWPARRPLAACRAALIATLLPDPGNDADRKAMLEKIGGIVKQENTFKTVGDRKIPVIKEFTEGGILHWGRESGPAMDEFREAIKKAYGGRAPRVLDPFAGGGAIPLEAMRLGCEATAVDINPVAWFILKCTLEYPQKFAGKTRPLPSFILQNSEFMEEFLKGTGKAPKKSRKGEKSSQPSMLEVPEADLAWHVRAWGNWVLERARKDLEQYYPVIDGKPAVAYLWARTVTCKNCRATIPLLKTLWLCHHDNKRIRLRMKPREDHTGVEFEIVNEPIFGGNAAQRRIYDQQVSKGTMTKSGAWCPICGKPDTIAMTKDDIKHDMVTQHDSGQTNAQMTAVVIKNRLGKEYRIPKVEEILKAKEALTSIDGLFKEIPYGMLEEPIFEDAKGSTWCIQYGLDKWFKLFTPRQLLALGVLVKCTRSAGQCMDKEGYDKEWIEALSSYLAIAVDKEADYNSSICHWHLREYVVNTFQRFAIPISWDYCECNLIGDTTGSYVGAIQWISLFLNHALSSAVGKPSPRVLCSSATKTDIPSDIVVTDPPYYDAIPYSDTMDFFYVWLRRTTKGFSTEIDSIFNSNSGPKWNIQENDGELVDDASRFGGDKLKSKTNYENGMFRAFRSCYDSLSVNGRIVIVFANKQPDAWETLAASVIKAGFVVDGSWPIQTEMANRTRALSSSALSSSVWLVCRKREETARPGWDNRVLEEMKENIEKHLPRFWDAWIRGPDLIWAATGPALEAFNKYPAVKKADQPDSVMTVSEFLGHVRRLVVDFAVGRILSENGAAAEGLDDLTIYYLLHRQSFGMEQAPVGSVILYCQSCKLSDRDLVDRFDILAHGKSKAAQEDEDEDGDADDGAEEETETNASTVKLKRWDDRKRKDLGIDGLGRKAPLIDKVHHIMQLWKAGDSQKVDNYLEETALRRDAVFPKLLQALIELARKDGQTDETSTLESIMNHVTGQGMHPQTRLIPEEENPEED